MSTASSRRAAWLSGVILAAGRSTRMGRPKLLLPLGGRCLLQHVVDAALASRLDEVVLVLGSEAEELRAALELPKPQRVEIRVCDGASPQLSDSLRCGLAGVSQRATAVAILLGDQPGIRALSIDRLAEAFLAADRPVVRPVYCEAPGREVPGHPVFLSRRVWPQLEALRGDRGAGALLARHPEWLHEVRIDGPAPADTDDWSDYERACEERAGGEG